MAALGRRDFAAAYDDLVALRRAGDLDSDGLYALGDAAWWLGLIRETIEIGEECHQRFLAEGRVDRAATAALEIGFHWMMRGQPEVGSGWLSRARRLLEDQPPGPGHGWLVHMEAQGRLAEGDLTGALEAAATLRRMAADLDAPALGCFGLSTEGMVAIRSGDVERGLALLDEAMLPVLAGRVSPAESGNLYCVMISVCTDLADVARARRWTEVTERWCALASDAAMFEGICRVHRAQLFRIQGDLDAAESAASAACAELAELNVEAVAEGHYEIGEARRLRGDLEGARDEYAAAAALGRTPQPGSALLLLAEGRSEEAVTSIDEALAEEADPFRRARLLFAQVEIACQRSDFVLADRAATELDEVASTYSSPGFRAWADTARGAVLIGCGSGEEAVPPLRAALSAYRAMKATHEEGAARALLAKVLGTGSQQVPPGGLTAREWEILSAVSEGLTNRQVAARLVISEKTVARHLANVYPKIGVSSRTAAAAWAHQETQPS